MGPAPWESWGWRLALPSIMRLIAALMSADSSGIRLRIDTIFFCCRERDVEFDFAVDGVELKTCRKVRP